MARPWIRCLGAGVSLALLVPMTPFAAEPPGILWESTSQTVIDGAPMQMPARTVKVCAAKEWTRPPTGGDPSCTTSDFKVVGSRATWSVRCTGEMPMTGAGEMTFEGSDSYNGIVRFAAEGMNMSVKLAGKKIGTCDDPR